MSLFTEIKPGVLESLHLLRYRAGSGMRLKGNNRISTVDSIDLCLRSVQALIYDFLRVSANNPKPLPKSQTALGEGTAVGVNR